MRHAILGTAGHIDHGKTALVQALTGVDTDRLPEEKARGITIDLGFAELSATDDLRLGVVDVPGHEDFVRTMVAGATGMDLVLLVVAADEGLMPQTREHLEIVRLLSVPAMVVALTKADLVEPDWLALVDEEVREVLAGTPYADAPRIPTSTRTGQGIEELRRCLVAAAAAGRARREDDLPRLPVDRAFTVPGMGTVVTGTLWSGTMAVGDRIRLLPSGEEDVRIRSLQVHGRDAPRAVAGERTAVALSGVDKDEVLRGHVLVGGAGWRASWMLTARVSLLESAPRPLEHGARIRVLLGTAEVMARVAVLEESGAVDPGETGWVQLRLEAPTVARCGDRLVLRSYSPMRTVGGGAVAETGGGKRRRLAESERVALDTLLDGSPGGRIRAAAKLAGWSGLALERLPQEAGATPGEVPELTASAAVEGAVVARGTLFAAPVVEDGKSRMLAVLDAVHAQDRLRPAAPLERLRAALPTWAAPPLADGVLERLAREGALELAAGGARRPGYRPTPTPDQAAACEELERLYAQAGLAAPFIDELPPPLREREDLSQLLRHLEDQGRLATVDDGLLMDAAVLAAAARTVAQRLGGRTDLGPADFREVLDVSRRHLMPLLAWLDGVGVTVRRGPVRDVSPGT